MKSGTALLIFAILKNIGLIVLAGFICWYMNTLWGLLALLFLSGIEIKE